ncbi:FecR family protein [Aquimarina sp. SS2-1]|uniref:FecR family protein n=1 Tax=Aquimarina besae TaxID=3342247 RepID=UPI00366FDDB7
MKEDKDLLKELLQTKFKDDIMQSSDDNFDRIFEAVQEKPDDKGSFFWYTVGVVVLILIGVVTLYYFKINKVSKINNEEITTEIPFQNENNILVSKTKDSVSNTEEDNNTVTKENKTPENTIQPKKNVMVKKVDVTTLQPEDEIIEKGVITVTYTASDKYASTENTKYNRLPDSSTIVVRKNSKVNFTATKQGYRRADVTGTIFFNIKSNVPEPFIVFGKHCKIQITGNSFAIHSTAEADLMTLVDGSAKVVHNITKEVKNLVPGQSLYVATNKVYVLDKSPNRFAWKTGILHYQNSSIEQIINDLGESYNAKIILKDANILNCKYSGSFEKATTAKVLTALVKSLDLQITKEDDVFMITGKGCSE